MRPSRAVKADIAQRRAQLIRMRVEGIPFAEIAVRLGYGGEEPEKSASKDFVRACRAARDLEVDAAEDRRYIQGLCLEQLLARYWPDAMGGDLKAAEYVLKVVADQRKLYGTDMPVQVEASISGVLPQDAALQEVIAQARARNTAKLAVLQGAVEAAAKEVTHDEQSPS